MPSAPAATAHDGVRRPEQPHASWRVSVASFPDRKLTRVRYQAPFDLLFGTGGFEYHAVVAPTGFEPALPP
jgi:hypothetical protein